MNFKTGEARTNPAQQDSKFSVATVSVLTRKQSQDTVEENANYDGESTCNW